ncbi:hypothetical protein EMIT0373P_50190 [Pseudomonas chlororaphis]
MHRREAADARRQDPPRTGLVCVMGTGTCPKVSFQVEPVFRLDACLAPFATGHEYPDKDLRFPC